MFSADEVAYVGPLCVTLPVKKPWSFYFTWDTCLLQKLLINFQPCSVENTLTLECTDRSLPLQLTGKTCKDVFMMTSHPVWTWSNCHVGRPAPVDSSEGNDPDSQGLNWLSTKTRVLCLVKKLTTKFKLYVVHMLNTYPGCHCW